MKRLRNQKLESRILNLEVKAGIRMPKYRPLESGSPYDLNKCNFAGGKRRRNEKQRTCNH